MYQYLKCTNFFMFNVQLYRFTKTKKIPRHINHHRFNTWISQVIITQINRLQIFKHRESILLNTNNFIPTQIQPTKRFQIRKRISFNRFNTTIYNSLRIGNRLIYSFFNRFTFKNLKVKCSRYGKLQPSKSFKKLFSSRSFKTIFNFSNCFHKFLNKSKLKFSLSKVPAIESSN